MTEAELIRHDRNPNGVAVQDNALIRSAYSMELREKRLLLLAISRIHSNQHPKQNQCIQVELHRDEWADMFPATNPWRDLKTACRGLMRRQVTMFPTEKSQLLLNWVDSVQYHEGGTVHLKFGYSMSIHLAGMLDEFTQIDLLDVSKFNSKHTVRLYELLAQMVNKNEEWWLKITIEDLRTYFDIGKAYSRYSQLNQYVINPALKELNDKSSWDITVERIKTGRSVTSLHFRFKEKTQLAMDF